MNHTISTLLAVFAVMTAVASGVFSTIGPLQNAGAADGCHTDSNGTTTCLDKHMSNSESKIELFFQFIHSYNNTETNTITASQKDTPFILPFP
ncbi:MAG TPA: hypothetical protein VE619_08205 [Nitrososphaeraceae archaeon]|nr:hypothetical protein [Nitrososphaeraceae archaeon]